MAHGRLLALFTGAVLLLAAQLTVAHSHSHDHGHAHSHGGGGCHGHSHGGQKLHQGASKWSAEANLPPAEESHHGHAHDHGHDHGHAHAHDHAHGHAHGHDHAHDHGHAHEHKEESGHGHTQGGERVKRQVEEEKRDIVELWMQVLSVETLEPYMNGHGMCCSGYLIHYYCPEPVLHLDVR